MFFHANTNFYTYTNTLFLDKVEHWKPAFLFKRDSGIGFFPVNFALFLRTPIFFRALVNEYFWNYVRKGMQTMCDVCMYFSENAAVTQVKIQKLISEGEGYYWTGEYCMAKICILKKDKKDFRNYIFLNWHLYWKMCFWYGHLVFFILNLKRMDLPKCYFVVLFTLNMFYYLIKLCWKMSHNSKERTATLLKKDVIEDIFLWMFKHFHTSFFIEYVWVTTSVY